MKTKRKQTRYETEQQIIDAIDRAKAKRHMLIAKAQCCNEDRLLKINAQVRRIEDSTLPRLKNCLAAFNTRLMEAITTDPAVI